MNRRDLEAFLKTIDVNEVLFTERFYLGKVSAKTKRNYFTTWYRELVFSSYSLPSKAEAKVLYFRSLVRDDYKSLFHDVIDAIGEKSCIVVEDYFAARAQPNINVSRFLSENTFLLEYIEAETVLERACLYLKLCQYFYVLNCLSAVKVKAALFFADMQPQEYVISKYLRYKGVTTATMQHGLYVDYGELKTVNVVNYRHHASEYFLAWGKVTAALIKQYHRDSKIIICGKPALSVANPVKRDKKRGRHYIYVVLDQPFFDAENFEMLTIAKKVGAAKRLDVRVKYHPQIDKGSYRDRFEELMEGGSLTDASFVVGHTSSLLYEAMTLGVKVFRYASGAPCPPTPTEIEFNDAEQLERICGNKTDNCDLSRRYIAYTGTDSSNRYKRAFHQMLSIKTDIAS